MAKREPRIYPQPLYMTLERELAFSHGAQLAAAKSVTLYVGCSAPLLDNLLTVWLPANQVAVTLEFEPGAPIPKAAIRLPDPKGGR